jgi:hypothetical protein
MYETLCRSVWRHGVAHRNIYYAVLLYSVTTARLVAMVTRNQYGGLHTLSARLAVEFSVNIFLSCISCSHVLFIFSSPWWIWGTKWGLQQIVVSVCQCFHPIWSGNVGEGSDASFLGLIRSCTSGMYVYNAAHFSSTKLCILPTQSIHIFRTVLTVNRFPPRKCQPVGLYKKRSNLTTR